MSAVERRPGPVPAAMTGPLAPFEVAVQVAMTRMGYAASSVVGATRAMRRLSIWMSQRGLCSGDLTPSVVAEFLADRASRCHNAAASRRWVSAVVHVLCQQGTVPDRDPIADCGRDVLLGEFRRWLSTERGLAAESVRCYCSQAAKLLAHVPDPLEESLTRLDAATVTAVSVAPAKAQVTATRALLRFLHVHGAVPLPLTAAVPGVAGWRLAALPRGLEAEQVRALLAAHDDVASPAGLRDHAVLVTLARLGLRGAEIAALRLDEVDWHRGEIVVRGKGARVERLPLPVEVGAAWVAYLTGARASCQCPTVFVTVRAPFQPLTACAVRAIMGRACQRAGVPLSLIHI